MSATYVLGMMEDLAKLLLTGGCIAAALAMYPRTRRTGYVMARFARAHMSPWMLALSTACLAIPGPLDEVVVVPVLFLFTLRTRRNRAILARYVRIAWSGGWA